MKELANHNILPITCPAHTSHIFQALGTLLFAQLKAIQKQLSRDLSFGCNLDHIMPIFRAYELTTIRVTMRYDSGLTSNSNALSCEALEIFVSIVICLNMRS
jgi:hypothetical protein